MRRMVHLACRRFSTVHPAPVSHYKRELPIVYIRLNSQEGNRCGNAGKAIFKEALLDGSMQCYFPLA